MKGQMFIISMVFLVGLTLAVQSNIGQYNFVHLSDTFKEHPGPLLATLTDDLQSAIRFSPNCLEARKRLQQLESIWESQHIGGINIDLTWTLNCDQWEEKPLQATIRLTSIQAETRSSLSLGR